MSADDDRDRFPRSMRHRQVLDAAEEHPDASIDEIASMVPSATADLVEHVFEEHGDPAAEDEEEVPMSSPDEDSTPVAETAEGTTEEPTESGTDSESVETGATAESEAPIDRATLSDRQRELLEVVAARPEATQGEIADHFDVTRATVSRWASEIDGFDWSERAALVDQAADSPTAVSTDGGSTAEAGGNGSGGADPEPQSLEAIADRVAALEGERSTGSVLEDPELLHKVVHACMESETISTEEELRIIESLMG